MKLFRGLAMVAATIGITFSAVSRTDAANVALLPLVNNVVEREDLGAIYYDRAVAATKLDVNFEIVDGAELDKAINDNVKPNTLPDKATCESIARAANVDYIFVMQADELGYKERATQQSDSVDLNFKGKCVGYNAVSGKYTMKNIIETDVKEGSLLARYDIVGQQFGDSVTREIKKALGIKKFGAQKQTLRLRS